MNALLLQLKRPSWPSTIVYVDAHCVCKLCPAMGGTWPIVSTVVPTRHTSAPARIRWPTAARRKRPHLQTQVALRPHPLRCLQPSQDLRQYGLWNAYCIGHHAATVFGKRTRNLCGVGEGMVTLAGLYLIFTTCIYAVFAIGSVHVVLWGAPGSDGSGEKQGSDSSSDFA